MCLKLSSFFMSFLMCFLSLFGSNTIKEYRIAAPAGLGHYTSKESTIIDDADFYVSPDGNDENDGSLSSPFASIDRAKEAVRQLDKNNRNGITVAVKAGDYRVSTLTFTQEDGGTPDCPVTYCAYGDGEVVLNGGISIDTKYFNKVTDPATLNRLHGSAKENILCTDLGQFGITSEQYGKIYAFGSYHTAAQYDGDYIGDLYCELFVNDRRQTIARYPDAGYLYTGKVLKTGLGLESDGAATKVEGWNDIRNPESDVYEIDKQLADRINSWSTFEGVWMFGFWKYDWADAATPIGTFDYAKRELSPAFVSLYGTKEGAPYYFFNVFEELDAPGEWYLDRANGILYLYPDKGFSTGAIDLTLTTKPVISANADNMTFSGFTVKGTRGDGITIAGDNNTVRLCTVKNIAGDAVIINGYNNLVSENEVTRTGKSGIVLTGGDRNTLTPGNNKADNNLIHDWSEIYQTYKPAVTLNGVGNVCSHNEIYNSPHEAITYSGNNHLIEYNVIHDVCLLSDDAGAIYSGRRWDWYGTVIRYNCLYDLGSNGHTPDGIYMDDALSGQTIYGNLLINVPKIGIHLGGGRDLEVRNNIIINTSDRPFSYDQRAIDGVNGGWFNYGLAGSPMWTNLFESPWQSDLWKSTYPQMAKINDNFENQNDPDFAPNPSYSTVSGNLIVNAGKDIGSISEKAKQFSDISGNAVYRLTKMNGLFNSPYTGDYSLKKNAKVFKQIPGFVELPLSEMGRY